MAYLRGRQIMTVSQIQPIASYFFLKNKVLL